MGFSISWIAFDKIGKSEAQRRMALRDTSELAFPGEERERQFSGAELLNGWYVLISGNFAFVPKQGFEELSKDCRLILCRVEEHVMASHAECYENGAEIWAIEHASERGIYDLKTTGSLPPSFASIREDLFKKQDDDGGDAADVDYIFDIPVTVAAAISGYRHDHDLGANEAPFFRLAPV